MLAFIRSSIGQKYIMGLSGLVWAGFVMVHMLGNLLILVGPDAYNSYAHAITSNKPLLFATEGVLILALCTHVISAISLTRSNRRAKGKTPYTSTHGAKGTTLASRSMAAQGAIVLMFIILHMITFKYGTHYEVMVNGVPMRDLSRLVLEVFHSWVYVAWYIVCLGLLGVHLSHGVGSIFQSFGLLHPSYQQKIKFISRGYGFLVAAGFLSQPIYVFLAT